MFHWFHSKPEKIPTGFTKIRLDFVEMLRVAQQEFLLACRVALDGVSADMVREELCGYDKTVNKAERQIRKELVVHASVRGIIEPECLVMMSIAKDAERLGDYSKNIFDMGELTPTLPVGVDREQLMILRVLIHRNFNWCMESIKNEDDELSVRTIRECQWAEKQCDTITEQLLNLKTPTPRTAADVLMYRFMKRMTSHLRNICSSVVQPLHKLDFTKKITKTMEMDGTLLDLKQELKSELEAELTTDKNTKIKPIEE